jgi:formylglycine-generating enzyme required for sulfatase activity
MTTRDTSRGFRVRGGSWFDGPRNCRSASRDFFRPDNADDDFGFRVVCLPGEVAPPRKLLRGGSWLTFPGCCRSAYRFLNWPDVASYSLGFRVVCLPGEVTPW